MEIYYATKKEAEEARQERVLQATNTFCPVIKGMCKGPMCASFFEGGVQEYDKRAAKPWKLYLSCCASPLITGTVTLEQ